MTNINEADLREAIKLLDKINSDPAHPANDARHSDHKTCVEVCEQLKAWCEDQQELLAKQRVNDGYLKLDY
ncbi:MAG: hypothetical protein QX203_05430 [Methylococcaceae bacterium]